VPPVTASDKPRPLKSPIMRIRPSGYVIQVEPGWSVRMRDWLRYYRRHGDWKFHLASLAIVIVVFLLIRLWR
jgi:hypothetical protein